MAKKTYTTKRESKVYHKDTDCTKGNNIEKRNMQSGTGDRRACKECK